MRDAIVHLVHGPWRYWMRSLVPMLKKEQCWASWSARPGRAGNFNHAADANIFVVKGILLARAAAQVLGLLEKEIGLRISS